MKLPLTVGPIDAPIAPRLAAPSPDPDEPRRGPGRRSTYSPETIAAAERCHAKGVSLVDTAELLGLTIEQVKYLRYVRPHQVRGANAAPRRGSTKTPLAELVPDPITTGHRLTSDRHEWIGQRTRYRSDLIRQVKACRGKGHKPHEVSRHFGVQASEVRYIWYQLPDENNPEN